METRDEKLCNPNKRGEKVSLQHIFSVIHVVINFYNITLLTIYNIIFKLAVILEREMRILNLNSPTQK